MEETKSLALLLVAAIIVSLGGTVVSLNKLGQLQIATLTGRVTDTGSGTVDLNLTSQTTITFTKSSVDFGNGYVNSTCNNCTMSSNSSYGGTEATNATCCLDEWKTIPAAAKTGLYVKNEGNTDLTVALNVSKNASVFIGGSSPAPLFQYIILPDSAARACTGTCAETGGTDGTASCSNSWLYSSAWQDVNTSNPDICANNGFLAQSDRDEFVIDFKVRVPRTATAAAKTAIIKLTGTS